MFLLMLMKTYHAIEGIDKKCEEEVKPCASLQAGTCCSKEPKQVRVTDGFGHCWCSGPFLNGCFSALILEAFP
eukprot:g26833.t1